MLTNDFLFLVLFHFVGGGVLFIFRLVVCVCLVVFCFFVFGGSFFIYYLNNLYE